MYNYTGDLSEQDFKEFERNYEQDIQKYVSHKYSKNINDLSLIDIITYGLIDLNEKMYWLKKIGAEEAIEELESFLAEKNATSDEVFVLLAVDADYHTDFWHTYFEGVFATFEAATKFIEEEHHGIPMFFLIKYRAKDDGTMDQVCTFIWEESRNCICYVNSYVPFNY